MDSTGSVGNFWLAVTEGSEINATLNDMYQMGFATDGA